MKKTMILIVLMLCSLVNAATYYVAPTTSSPAGNDAIGSGSSGSPWATIGFALTATTYGDTILVRDGTYSIVQYVGAEWTGSMTTALTDPVSWKTIQAVNDGSVTITATSADTYALQLGDYAAASKNYKLQVKFDGISFIGMTKAYNCLGVFYDNCTFTGYGATIGVASLKLAASSNGCDFRMEDCTVTFASKIGIEVGDTDYVDIKNTEVYNVGENGIRMAETQHAVLDGVIVRDLNLWNASYHLDGIGIWGTTVSAGTITIKNSIFRNCVAQGLFVSCDVNQINLENNRFDYNSNGFLCGGGTSDYGVIHDVNMVNNTFTSGVVFYSGITGSLKAHNNVFINLPAIDSTKRAFIDANNTEVSDNIYWNKYKTGTQKFISDYDTNPINIRYQPAAWDILTSATILADFTDPNINNFMPILNSEIYNAGDADYATATDIFGIARGSTPDIGAIEYYVAPVPTVPSAPSGLALTVTSSQVNLSWVDVNDENGYKVERAPDNGGNPGTFTQISITGIDANTYQDAGRAAATKYHYQVKAFNNVGDSNYCPDVNATTSAAAEPPTAITGVSAIIVPVSLGDITLGADVYLTWYAGVTDGNIAVYKDNSTTALKGISGTSDVNGITDIRGFAGLVGINNFAIDTSNIFYEYGRAYTVILEGGLYGVTTVNTVLGYFTIQKSYQPSMAPLETGINSVSSRVEEMAEKVDEVDDNVNVIRQRNNNKLYGD